MPPMQFATIRCSECRAERQIASDRPCLYCPDCGAPLPLRCTTCHQEVPRTIDTCPACKGMRPNGPARCPHCEAKLDDPLPRPRAGRCAREKKARAVR
ncbi:MAG: hypothetical protein PHI63_04110 [Patescibacteria group bacterium]|nr:hypothetical protein [Patescibacteria group bacterium]